MFLCPRKSIGVYQLCVIYQFMGNFEKNKTLNVTGDMVPYSKIIAVQS